jgi:hypothetical protein
MVIAAAALATVVLLGGYASLIVGAGNVMSSAGCGGSSTGLICSGRGQTLAFFVPLAGWLAAVALTVLSTAGMARRREGLWWPVALGGGVFIITTLISVWIADH